MELLETVKMMESEDYRERFRAEYFQLKIRMEKLGDLLNKYRTNALTFAPKCDYELLFSQYIFMKHYKDILEERAKIEEVNLEIKK